MTAKKTKKPKPDAISDNELAHVLAAAVVREVNRVSEAHNQGPRDWQHIMGAAYFAVVMSTDRMLRERHPELDLVANLAMALVVTGTLIRKMEIAAEKAVVVKPKKPKPGKKGKRS